MGDSPPPESGAPKFVRSVSGARQQPPQTPQAQTPPPQKRGLTRKSRPVICRVLLLDGEVMETSIHVSVWRLCYSMMKRREVTETIQNVGLGRYLHALFGTDWLMENFYLTL